MKFYGNLINRIVEGGDTPIEPEIGMDATATFYSDRHAGEIIRVSKNGRAVDFREFNATLAAGEQVGSQNWILSPDANGRVSTFTRRQNGRWVKKGESMREGTRLLLGIRDHHYDWEF